MLDFEPAADGRGDLTEVVRIGADDEAMAAQRPFDDACVHDIRGSGPGGQRPDRSGPVVVEGLDIAADEESGQQRLAAASPPALGHDGRRHRGDFPGIGVRQDVVSRQTAGSPSVAASP